MIPASDRAWVIDPGWLAYLGGYRMYNYIGTTWHYLAAGPELERIGQSFKRLSHGRRLGRADWFEAEAHEGYFSRCGSGLRLNDAHYHRERSTLLAESDLSLNFASRRGGDAFELSLDAMSLRLLGDLLSLLRHHRPAAGLRERPELLDVARALRQMGLIAEVPRVEPLPRRECSLRLTGHGGVVVQTPSTRIAVDPLLTLRYRPDVNGLFELSEPLDAVVLTHAHWSHFDIDTLLHIDRRTPMYLPLRLNPVSLDNIDMAALLEELGFEEIRFLQLWAPSWIGDIRITATPFRGSGLGEMSAVDWHTLHVSAGGVTAFLAVDACSDQRGCMDEVVRAVAQRLGPVDVLLASYEHQQYPIAWFTRRPFYLGPGREQASTSPDDAVRWTAMLNAKLLVPYASFAWSGAELWAPARERALYGGVTVKGDLRQVESQMALWPAGKLLPLTPGGQLRWPVGGALRVPEPVRPVAARRGAAMACADDGGGLSS